MTFPNDKTIYTNPDGSLALGTSVGGRTHSQFHSQMADDLEGVFNKVGHFNDTPLEHEVLVGRIDGQSEWKLIGGSNFADNSITGVKIADLNITTGKLADLSVTTGKIQDGSITSIKIAELNVTTDKIAANAVTNDKVADNAINTAEIVDLAVTSGKLADNAVTNQKVADNAINTNEIVDLAVTTGKLAANAVTDDKLAANAAGQYGHVQGPSSISTTSTSYVNMTTMSITFTTTGGDILVWFSGNFYHNTDGSSIYIAFNLDGGADQAGMEIGGWAPATPASNTWRFTGVSAGSHTVRTRWSVDGGTGNSNERQMVAMELR